MFTIMTSLPDASTYQDDRWTGQDHGGGEPAGVSAQPAQAARSTPRATPGKHPAGMDTRAARSFARRVLAARADLDALTAGDVALLERLTGEKKLIKGSLDELTVVLVSGSGSGRATGPLVATADLLSAAAGDPLEAVVEATLLAADSPEVFREVFSLARELGVHDLPRTPSGHEVLAATTLIQACREADLDAVQARLARLSGLIA